MRRRIASWLLAAVLLALGVRLAVTAARLETGWESLYAQWRDAALGWTGLLPLPLAERDPIDQAHFWLKEADRVARQHPDSADVMIGAAWMLDSPNHQFLARYVRVSFHPALGSIVDDDRDLTDQMQAEFKTACHASCLSYAARATTLAPEQPDLWRMRAMLLFEFGRRNVKPGTPRSGDWLEVLDECHAHDPDNSLYDYLAAWSLLNQSAEWTWPDDLDDSRAIVKVSDQETFKLGMSKLAAAQEHGMLRYGESSLPSIARFLSETHLLSHDQQSAALSRSGFYKFNYLVTGICRWLSALADDANRRGDNAEGLRLLQSSLGLFYEATESKDLGSIEFATRFSILRTTYYARIERLLAEHPELANEGVLQLMREREFKASVEAAVSSQAVRQLNQEVSVSTADRYHSAVFTSITSQFTAMLGWIAGVMLGLAVLVRSAPIEKAKFGLAPLILTHLLCYAAVFAVLGMAPAEMISKDAQYVIAIGLFWSLALAVAAWVSRQVYLVMKRRRFRFRLIYLLATMTVAAVLAAMWPFWKMVGRHVSSRHQQDWSVPPAGWGGIDADTLRTGSQLEPGTWDWAFLQWLSHNGVYWSLAAPLIALALYGLWRLARDEKTPPLVYWTNHWRKRWPPLLRLLGRSALGAGCGWLLLYLLLAPVYLMATDAEFQQKMLCYRSPERYAGLYHEAADAIHNSPEEMKAIHEAVEFEMSDADYIESNSPE